MRSGKTGSGELAEVVFSIAMVAVVSFLGIGTAVFSSLTGPTANPTDTVATYPGGTGSSFVVQWNLAYFDTPTVPGCAAGPSSTGPWTPVPCNGPRADAILFNCAARAASPEGCTLMVSAKNATARVSFTAWCPYNGTARPYGPYLLNATWSEFTKPPSNPPNAVCVMLNSTAFLMAEPHNNIPA